MGKIQRIGFWFSEEKLKKLRFMDFIQFCQNSPMEFVQLDLSISLEEQGPFDLVIHKINDLIIEADQGDERAQIQINRFQEYFTRHPETVACDPFLHTRRLLDRYQSYELILQSDICKKDSNVFIPKFVKVTTNDTEAIKNQFTENGLQFPIVSKPLLAEAHEMALIFNERGLRDVQAPYVAQTFINHCAVLYKLYVIGDELYFVQRPSLKNFTSQDNETIFFHTFDVSKQKASVFLTKMDPNELAGCCGPQTPKEGKLQQIADSIRKTLGMDLLGVDVIIEDETCKYAVIDANAFPGYKGVTDFFQVLRDFMVKKIESHHQPSRPPICI